MSEWQHAMKGVDKGFGSRLRFVRERWQLTQEGLPKKVMVGVATIRRIKSGKFEPRLSSATKLADALQVQVRVEWLLIGDEPMLLLAIMTTDKRPVTGVADAPVSQTAMHDASELEVIVETFFTAGLLCSPTNRH